MTNNKRIGRKVLWNRRFLPSITENYLLLNLIIYLVGTRQSSYPIRWSSENVICQEANPRNFERCKQRGSRRTADTNKIIKIYKTWRWRKTKQLKKRLPTSGVENRSRYHSFDSCAEPQKFSGSCKREHVSNECRDSLKSDCLIHFKLNSPCSNEK